MRLELATKEAMQYACVNFHYTRKPLDNISFGFSVFNDKGEWCGIVAYGRGNAPNIAKPFGLVQGQVIELLRVALNGKQNTTSSVVARSLKLLRKYAPLVKVVVSFADANQDHIGTIYQASNWIYIGESISEKGIRIKGRLTHKRSVGSKYGSSSIKFLRKHVDKNAEIIHGLPKYKYVYPIDKKLIQLCKSLSKPYPKKTSAGNSVVECSNSIGKAEGSNPIPAL